MWTHLVNITGDVKPNIGDLVQDSRGAYLRLIEVSKIIYKSSNWPAFVYVGVEDVCHLVDTSTIDVLYAQRIFPGDEY